MVLGAVSEGRSSSRKINFLLRKLRFWCLAYDIALELAWVLTWTNPADAPSRGKPIESWYASLPKFPPTLTAVFASVQGLSELDLLREPLSVAAHAVGEHVQRENTYVSSNPPVPSVVRKRNLHFHAFECAGLPRTKLALLCSHLYCSKLVQCTAWTRSACGITTGLLAK